MSWLKMTKKTKYKLYIEVYEDDGRPIVHHSSEEMNATMKDIGLVIYKIKQVEQELIDRVWDGGGEGYEIIDNEVDNDDEEEKS